MVPIPKRHYTIVGQIIMLNPPSRNEYIFIYIYIWGFQLTQLIKSLMDI